MGGRVAEEGKDTIIASACLSLSSAVLETGFSISGTEGVIGMRFRFGWRKEQQDDKQLSKIMTEYVERDTSKDSLLQEVATPTRVMFFGNHDETGSLYSLFLRSKGYQVFHFSSPATCALINEQQCTCPRDQVCADILIADMHLEVMTGLELIRHQKERGCLALPEHKAVIAKGFTLKQEHEAFALGCKTLLKPFRLMDMMEWIKKCETNIPPGRKLIPQTELLKTV